MNNFLNQSFLFLSTIIWHFFFININFAYKQYHFSICMIFSNQLAHFYLIFFLFPIISSIFYCVCSIIYFLSLFSKWSSFLSLFFFEYFIYLFTYFLISFFFPFIFTSWRLITLQYCSGFCHTLA